MVWHNERLEKIWEELIFMTKLLSYELTNYKIKSEYTKTSYHEYNFFKNDELIRVAIYRTNHIISSVKFLEITNQIQYELICENLNEIESKLIDLIEKLK